MVRILARWISPAPPGAGRELLRRRGDRDLVVPNVRFQLEEELPILGVIDRLVDVLAGECPDRLERLPQGNEQELGTPSVDPPENVNAATSPGRQAVLDARLLEVRQIPIGLLLRGGSLPDTRDHR